MNEVLSVHFPTDACHFLGQRNVGSASQSEAMMVAVGFSPRTDGKTESRRVATAESALGRAINLQASLRDAGPFFHSPVG